MTMLLIREINNFPRREAQPHVSAADAASQWLRPNKQIYDIAVGLDRCLADIQDTDTRDEIITYAISLAKAVELREFKKRIKERAGHARVCEKLL